jgi:hypothetical protein
LPLRRDESRDGAEKSFDRLSERLRGLLEKAFVKVSLRFANHCTAAGQ